MENVITIKTAPSEDITARIAIKWLQRLLLSVIFYENVSIKFLIINTEQ